jgi:hypothetical protein
MTAYSRYLPLVALTALMTTSGCVCVTGGGGGGGGGGARGNVTFLWTFQGRQCFEVPEVTSVAITIPGQTLQNNGVYGCTNSGTAGITLLDFRGTTYTYTIRGLNQVGQVVYESSGSFVVNGNVTVTADLQPTASATGSVYVTWSFPAGSPVNCQYLTAVDIEINGAPYRTVTCQEGATSPGVLIQGLTVGNNTITLLARDANQFYYYRTDATFAVFAGGASSQQFTMQWAVGSLPVKWSFNNGATVVNCAQAGVTQVNVNLRDAQGNYLYGSAGTDVPCLSNGEQGTVFPYLYSGNYQVFLQAYGTAGALYRSSFTVPPQATVTAGQFPVIDTTTPVILMSL